MRFRKRLGFALVCLGLFGAKGFAQEKGYWRAASKTAKSITGDVSFSETKININFYSTTIAEIRDLKPEEVSALFDMSADEPGAGKLFRLSIPGGKTFLHHNTLCGAEETQWMVVYAQRRSLDLAFLSGSAMPVLTRDAISKSTDLCGTFSYVR